MEDGKVNYYIDFIAMSSSMCFLCFLFENMQKEKEQKAARWNGLKKEVK